MVVPTEIVFAMYSPDVDCPMRGAGERVRSEDGGFALAFGGRVYGARLRNNFRKCCDDNVTAMGLDDLIFVLYNCRGRVCTNLVL